MSGFTEQSIKRHIAIAQAIDDGVVLRQQIIARVKCTAPEFAGSIQRLKTDDLIEVVTGAFGNGHYRAYRLARPMHVIVASLEPLIPKSHAIYSDALSEVWRMPVEIPAGKVSYKHVGQW
jgi:hypothetical protein